MAGFRLTKMLGLEAPRSSFRNNQSAALKSMEARQPAYSTIQNRGSGIVGRFLPQQIDATQSLADYYKAGPDDAGLNASNASALRTMDSGYAAGAARLKALGARTGADTSGAMANLEAGRVAASFPIQQSIAARRQAEVERFKRGSATTTGQMAGQGMGMELQGLQGGQGLDSQIYGAAGNLAAAEEAQKQATFQRIMSFVQQAGQMAGGAYGGRGAKASSPQAPGQSPVNLGYSENAVQGPDGFYFDPSGDGYDYSYYPGGFKL